MRVAAWIMGPVAVASLDVEVIPFPAPQPTLDLNYTAHTSTVPSTGQKYTVHYGVLGDPRYFGMNPQPGGCSSALTKVSKAAAHYGCEYATNGAFFSQSAPYCIGGLWSNGTQLGMSSSRTNFGVLANGSYVVGTVTQEWLAANGVQQLVEGLGWLVRDGKINTEGSADLNTSSSFFTEKAPRTGLGIMPDGRLVLAQVDGIELAKQGVSLAEFAEILYLRGVLHAVNVDGGGSSDSVYKGKVVGKPTCSDTPLVCERGVASVTCIYPEPLASWGQFV
mmetsp:Transcript_78176/g.209017  ORF Transcript_78176/g.209017 Transcript_78176/m.209017 type:complete len:278 (-) Transcript_78176:82-915(-)